MISRPTGALNARMSVIAMLNVVTLAVISIVGTIVKEYLDERRSKRIAGKLEKSDTIHADQIGGLADKIDVVDEKIGKVEIQTNHIKDELVAEVRKASFAAGAKSETDKSGNAGG